jgi:cell division protein FtsL
MKKINSILPTQSLIYFLICGAGILVFVLLIIIPTQQTSAELDRDIEKLNARIDEQRILKPVFDKLLKQVKKKGRTKLPATKKVKLARGEINKISERLLEIARRYDLQLHDIQTDVNALENNAGYLLIRIHATGDFKKFRDFMVDLGAIPSLVQFEEIRIRAIENSREFKLKVRLAQQ